MRSQRSKFVGGALEWQAAGLSHVLAKLVTDRHEAFEHFIANIEARGEEDLERESVALPTALRSPGRPGNGLPRLGIVRSKVG